AGVLDRREEQLLVKRAAAIFYQDRHWPAVLKAVEAGWSARARKRWATWSRESLDDLKARDARECLDAAQRFLAAPAPPPLERVPTPPSSYARRRKLAATGGLGGPA